jgi:hypothetical protein
MVGVFGLLSVMLNDLDSDLAEAIQESLEKKSQGRHFIRETKKKAFCGIIVTYSIKAVSLYPSSFIAVPRKHLCASEQGRDYF